jgi:hypothetical protein
MLSGTASRGEPCQPAWSRMRTACVPGSSCWARLARNKLMVASVASGRASAKAWSVPGRQAANR